MNRKIKIRVELSETDLARLVKVAETLPATSLSPSEGWLSRSIKEAISLAFMTIEKAGKEK